MELNYLIDLNEHIMNGLQLLGIALAAEASKSLTSNVIQEVL